MTDAEIAFAKINLALHVRRRRADGYHELETLFAFADDGDRLTATAADDLTLTITGPFGSGLDNGTDNLVLRAAQALRTANGITAGAALTLDKRLPIASGIGGGSADAAATLRLLARLWRLDENAVRPMDVAAPLGADVPACILSKTVRGEGVGDRLLPVDGSALTGLPVLLVNPLIACPTGPVFAAWDGVDRGPLDPADWQGGRNDLQPPAVRLIPAIGDLLSDVAMLHGAQIVRMSGSGATCFAIFDTAYHRNTGQAAITARYAGYWTMATTLR